MESKIYYGDCLEVLPTLEAGSVDAVIADIPYGTIECKWDSVIPFDAMWQNLKRIAKTRSAIVLFGSQPFTSALIMSNPKMFRYCWSWNKGHSGNIGLAKHQPLKLTEDIAVFSMQPHNYYPMMVKGKGRMKGGINKKSEITPRIKPSPAFWSDIYYPTNILEFSTSGNKHLRQHPTQKPIALMEYLVRTYTNEGDTVLDFTMGSGTTGVACMNLNRRFVGIEKDAAYFEIAQRRIEEVKMGLSAR